MTVLELIQLRGLRPVKDAELMRARRIAIWWLTKTQGMTPTTVAKLAGISRGRVHQLVARIEWRIDYAVRRGRLPGCPALPSWPYSE